MAVLTAQIARPTQGGFDSPLWAADLYRRAFIEQPFESEAQRWPGGSALVPHWPVEANGRPIVAQRCFAFLDDFYYRIHISPSLLDLGNVVSAQTTDVYLWNAFLESRTLSAINGLGEGLLVSGQPAAPLLFPALKELQWQVTVTPDGQPVLDTTVEWAFDNGAEAGLRITANRIIAWSFAPDWADGVIERLTWATDILQSESAVEQRRAIRLSPRREFEASMYVEGRERQLLDLALFGWGSRVWALPIWHEVQLLGVGVSAGALSIICSTQYLDFRAGGLAMLRGESAFTSETVEVDSVTPVSLLLKRPTQQTWPAGSRLYPVRSAQLTQQPDLTRLTDTASSADVQFLVVDPCDWPALMPTTLYRGQSVFETRPDEGEDLTSSYQRLLLTLDSGSAIPLMTDTANRAFPVQAHRWLEMGRSERAALRSFIYAMQGRQKSVWLPTHADDLTLVDIVSSLATTLDIANIGYSRFASAKPGRRDIRIELWDGSVYFRRITGSSELSSDIERISIDATFGRQILPVDIVRISWLVLCRLDSDTVEIEHMTDSEGLAATQLVFRGVRDDEF